MGELTGRVVVVTGASGNLGSAVAERLLRAGAKVCALVHRDAERATLTGRLVAALGSDAEGRIDARAAELADERSVAAAYDAAEARLGPLWGSVHCAGGWVGAPLVDTSLEVFDRMLTLNLRSAFLCSREAARRLSKRGEGRIVNVAAYGPATLTNIAGQSAYAASKAGVIALTKALADELAEKGVRANCVAPGTLQTSTNSTAMPQADASKWVPLPDVAEAIAYLLAPSTGAVTGTVLTLPSG